MQPGSLLARIPQLLRRRRLQKEVARTEQALLTAEAAQRAVLLSTLSDAHRELGDERTAAGCLGTAIDSCLAVGHLESAAALCRKMLSVFPSVVRAHGTLGFLLLARGSYRQAEWELAQYLKASRDDGTASYAAERLRMTAPAFPSLEERIMIGRLLRQAGNVAAAECVEEMAVPERCPTESRKMLAALLRRSVRAHLMRPTDAPATVRLDDADEPVRAPTDLPMLDTTVVRGAERPAGAKPPVALIGEDWDDLPFMDTTLPMPEPRLEEHRPPTPKRRRGSRAA